MTKGAPEGVLPLCRASAPLFQTGWFVESLATQAPVLFVIRTAGSPLRSRPSVPLAITVTLVVLIGVAVPAYLWRVELARRRLVRPAG